MTKILMTTAASILIIVAHEKGGVRKTAICELLYSFFSEHGVVPILVQMDRQSRLKDLFPETFSINMPSSEELRVNDLADADAFEIIMEIILSKNNKIIIIDVGANYDSRLFDYAISTELNKLLKEQGTECVVCLPITSDSEVLVLGSRTARRARTAFPDARIVPFIDDYKNFTLDLLDDATRTEIAAILAPLTDQPEKIVRFRRIASQSWAIANASGRPYSAFADLTAEEVGELFPRRRGATAVSRSEVVMLIDTMWKDLENIFQFQK